MKTRCRHDALVNLSELREHPKNPNRHSNDQIERLAQIFEYQGIRHPIVVSKLSGFVTKGHGRLAAAKKLGLEQFPVEYQEYESEEQEYADIVADNSIALWAELDLGAINSVVPELGPDFDIDLLGLNKFTVDVSEKELPDENGPTEKKMTSCPSCSYQFYP